MNELGLQKSKFSSHSVRRGAVVWAERNGVEHELIKVYGDWSSDAYKQYLQFPEEKRVAVAHHMAQRLANYTQLF